MKRAFLWFALVAACGGPSNSGFDDGGLDASIDGDANPFQQPDTGPSIYSDFPTNPFVDPSLPSNIAPVDAPGSVVYWSSTGGTSFKGFTVGDLQSKTVLTPTTASPASAGAGTTVCVSCHTSSPDGTYIMYTRDTGANSRPRAIDA